MDEADLAVANAISFEAKKDGLQQRQSGEWVLRLTVQALDMDQKITTAPMGTRFQCVLVEVGDNEEPVDHEARERRVWHTLGPTKQACIRCADPIFRAYLREALACSVESEQDAAKEVRALCGVGSRKDLSLPGMGDARVKWHNIDNDFQAWKIHDAAT